MMNNYLCIKLLNNVNARRIPESWNESRLRIKKDHERKELMVEDDIKLYGINTLVGHEEDISINKSHIEEYQGKILKAHLLGTKPYFNDLEALCVGFTKAHLYSLGGSAISPELYNFLIDAVSDPLFKPKIPKYASYSCGDVIPASHWAIELLKYIKEQKGIEYNLKHKEGISLINGTFVQVGIALSKISSLNSSFNAFSYSSILSLNVCHANRSGMSVLLTTNKADSLLEVINKIINHFEKYVPTPLFYKQDPISLRAIPQVLSAFSDVYKCYLETIDLALNRRSDNLLILYESEKPLSQASFFFPQLSLMVSQLIETIMLSMWMVERRIHYVLSGTVPNVPVNAKIAETDLGLIQVPKLSTAILEYTRLNLGRRNFASGSSTSYGIEDLWDCSLILLDQLEKAIEEFNKLLSIELYVYAYCLEHFLNFKIDIIDDIVKTNRAFSEKVEAINNLIVDNKIHI